MVDTYRTSARRSSNDRPVVQGDRAGCDVPPRDSNPRNRRPARAPGSVPVTRSVRRLAGARRSPSTAATRFWEPAKRLRFFRFSLLRPGSLQTAQSPSRPYTRRQRPFLRLRLRRQLPLKPPARRASYPWRRSWQVKPVRTGPPSSCPAASRGGVQIPPDLLPDRAPR